MGPSGPQLQDSSFFPAEKCKDRSAQKCVLVRSSQGQDRVAPVQCLQCRSGCITSLHYGEMSTHLDSGFQSLLYYLYALRQVTSFFFILLVPYDVIGFKKKKK